MVETSKKKEIIINTSLNVEKRLKKERSKKLKKREKGITLISLVITIIIILILAGVTLSSALRTKWIVPKSKNNRRKI